MNILDWFRKPKKPKRHTTGAYLAGQRSRLSVDKAGEAPPFSTAFFIDPPPNSLDTWRTQDLNDKTLSRVSPAKLVELMADVSPEVSRALWDFLRFCNPGWEAMALRPGSDEQDNQGQAALEEMLDNLDDLYGSFDVVLARLFLAGFLRGAFLAELVLDDAGREFIDLATPDPYSVRFRKLNDPDRGVIWQPGQWQGGSWVPLDAETIRYIPIDPLPGSPYGRSLVAPAIFTALFLIGLLHDLRRVVAQQGYPRLDLEIKLEELFEAMPADLENDPEATKNWVTDIINEVEDVYAALEPDDAYIHTSVVQVNRPVGTVSADSLGAVDALIRALERMATRALKTMPLLMGSNEAVSETHANRQWEIHVAGIKSVQHLAETLLERLFGLALEAQGIQADVEFRFAELRASEMLRDAQVEAMQISNARAKYENGWISQDEASEEVTGSPAELPEPRQASSGVPMILQDDGDGEERTGIRHPQYETAWSGGNGGQSNS